MGKKAKNTKKGKGAEKTALKTEKKLTNKLKKELKLKGENDIEAVLAEIEKEEKMRQQIIEKSIDVPTRRLNFSFISHPDKDQLILYGGEFFDGQKTFVYNDLLFYNLLNNTWTLIKAPGAPPPRCSHQMVATSTNGGQLWIFGGEFSSTSRSQFYHYQDLWVFHLVTKKWEKITAPNGPSSRSGHRMVLQKKKLFVFGGFHDNLRQYKYFNDVYIFNLENYEWSKLDISGNPPMPRSGCVMLPLNDGRILIYGGYSKENLKKDVEKGRVHSDAFILQQDKNDPAGLKWKWVQTKMGGVSISPRCSMPSTMAATSSVAYCFGGVFDVEDEEDNLTGQFYNDFWALDTEKLQWRVIQITGPKAIKKDADIGEDIEMVEDVLHEPEEDLQPQEISNDGIFRVTVGPSVNSPSDHKICEEKATVFQPCPRTSCGLAIKRGVLYLYGGMFEQGDKQITLNDFYSIDLKKLNEWKTIIEDKNSELSWVGSESETDSSSDEETSDDEESE